MGLLLSFTLIGALAFALILVVIFIAIILPPLD